MYPTAWPTMLAQDKRWFSLMFLLPFIILFIQTLWSQCILAHEQLDIQSAPNAINATNPLIYKRLRFDDDFLQVYQRFQKYLTIDERKVTFEANQTQEDNKTRLVEYTYYENNQVEATNLTQDDVIFEALDQSYFTRLFPAYLFTYDNKRDMAESSDPSLVSRRKCNRELDFLMSQLNVIQNVRLNGAKTGFQSNNTLSMEVMALFDTYGAEEPGLIIGNYLWSGYWRQCKRSLIFNRDTVNPENTLEFKTRYCIASIRSKRWDEIAASRIPDLEKHHFKYPEQRYDYARFHRIQIGLCIPESCDSNLINQRREDVRRLTTHKLNEPLRSYELSDLYCLPDETSKLRQVDLTGRLFLAFTTLWLAIVFSATLYDYRVGLDKKFGVPARPTGFLEKMVDSMSFLRNFVRLFETKSLQPSIASKQLAQQATGAQDVKQFEGTVNFVPERKKLAPNDLLFMNCIKSLSTPTIVLGHCGMVSKHLDRFALDYACVNMIVSHFNFSAVFFVDWYFVITGFITTYVMFVTKRVESNTLATWVHTIVHRYLRLAPMYLLLFWFAKSVVKHTSSGPIWDYGTNNMTLRAICQRESFIYPLTLTSNLHPIHDECVMPSWYVSCDFQYYLITPFLLILLRKSPLMGWLASLGAIGACIALRLHRYMTDPRAKHMDLMKPRYDLYMRNNWDMHPTYIYPQYRIASYLVGILAGHYTYMVLSGQWQSRLFHDGATNSSAANSDKAKTSEEDPWIKKRKGLLRSSVWTFSVTVMFSMMFVTGIISYYPQSLEPYVKYITSFTYSISHAGISLGLSLFLITMMLGQCSSLNRFMSLPFWTVISRLGYVIFLIQIELIFWITQSADRISELNALELFKGFVSVIAAIYPLSIILTLLFEMPIAHLERNFVAPLFRPAGRDGAHKPEAVLPPSSSISTRRNNATATGCAPPKQAGGIC